MFWSSRGFETFTIPHHTTVTMRDYDKQYPLSTVVKYPSKDEKFRVGMHYSSKGSTNASSLTFNPSTTEFTVENKIFEFSSFDGYHAEVVWTKGEEKETFFSYKPATRASAAASLAVPVILHSSFASHHEFAAMRTDFRPYSYLTNDSAVVRNMVDTLVVDTHRWEDMRRHAFEISRCYHSELIVDMYVRVFLYLIKKRG